ncbi:MAG: DAK2 domain-containing protein [Armatimonadota bacterium]|nr:DAK2 domain-containing protein [Armatimonadota bacterium]MDR7568837.1 DAK2 domain-containing protein [Armatimonadota bacterium]MDR7602265.1 DAK2 domain-containing protein [Armatimonadota bacterium]
MADPADARSGGEAEKQAGERFTGEHFAAALEAALAELRRCCAEVNALNVFPVADHDTGSNLCATLAAAVEAVRAAGSSDLGETAAAAARGAFLGARGSSGAILAEYLYGLSEAWRGVVEADAARVAAALRIAANSARSAVQEPVEGTVLTVAAAAAAGAEAHGDRLPEVLVRAAATARLSWLRTPQMLPVLRRAGVVDAGAAGLVALLEAMAGTVRGTVPPPLSPPAPLARIPARAAPSLPATARYCTEVLVRMRDMPVTRVRRTLQRLGDAVVVAERDGLVRIHLHTSAPHLVLARVLRWGSVEEVRATRLPQEPSGDGEACPGEPEL